MYFIVSFNSLKCHVIIDFDTLFPFPRNYRLGSIFSWEVMFLSSSPKAQKSFLSMLLGTFRTCVAAPKKYLISRELCHLWHFIFVATVEGWSCPFCILESGSTPVFQSDIRQILLTTQVAEDSNQESLISLLSHSVIN